MRLLIAIFVCLLAIIFASGAEARSRHHYRHHRVDAWVQMIGGGLMHMMQSADRNRYDTSDAGFNFFGAPVYQPAERPRGAGRARYSDGRPHAWCGWYMRQIEGVADTAYNVAANWAHWGTNAGAPAVGAIVVFRHHVGKIVGRENGQWIMTSGNDGNAVRTRPVSLRGAIAFRLPSWR